MAYIRLGQQNIYTAIWLLYYLQGVLYPGGGTLSRLLAAVFILWSFYYFLKIHIDSAVPNCLKTLDILVVLYSLYGIVLLYSGTDDSWVASDFATTDFLKNSLLSFLPIYSFTYLTQKKLISEDWFRIFFLLLLFFCAARFFYIQNQAMDLSNVGADGVTNNAGYVWLTLMPFLPFYNKAPLKQYLFLLVICVFILLGMKRGAILIATFTLAYFFWHKIKYAKKTERIILIILTLLVILALSIYVRTLFTSNSYFVSRVQSTLNGDSSGRGDIYLNCWHAFQNSPLINKLIGNGACGTLKIAGVYAHQDWLEALVDFGILGVICLTIYFISLFRAFIISRRICSRQLYLIFGLVLIVYFTKAMFSMSLTSAELMTTAIIGYCIGVMANEPNVPEEFWSGPIRLTLEPR